GSRTAASTSDWTRPTRTRARSSSAWSPEFDTVMAVSALSTLVLALALQLPGETGQVRGQVRSEETGEILPGATVEVVDARPARAVASGIDGSYMLPAVPAGRRTIRARHVGFAPFEMEVVVP